MSDVLNYALHLPQTKTKDMSAIKRIEGYCCEVTTEQWRELVKVADEVGCPVGIRSRRQGPDSNRGHAECFNNGVCEVLALKRGRNHESIPFDSFLAKLRGDVEPWTPKAGEQIEPLELNPDKNWFYICPINGGVNHIVWDGGITAKVVSSIRPSRPRMTRAEAEAKLNCIITD